MHPATDALASIARRRPEKSLLHPSSRPARSRPGALRALGAALVAATALAACGGPSADRTPAALAGERYAHALLRAPTRKPCSANAVVACRTVRRSTLL